MLPTWLVALLVILATHRVTRFITRDALPIVAVPRDAFSRRWATLSDAQTREERRTSLNGRRTNVVMSSVAYLWECDWCTSVWVAAAVVYGTWALTAWPDRWWHAVLLGLAASTGTGLIAQREPD